MPTPPITPTDYKAEHDLVVKSIQETLGKDYEVLSNVDKEQFFIERTFPDLILRDKITHKPIFIIEVKRNGGIANCLQQWRAIKDLPAILYIVVPEPNLSETKTIASIIGVPTRFASYKIENGTPIVQFE